MVAIPCAPAWLTQWQPAVRPVGWARLLMILLAVLWLSGCGVERAPQAPALKVLRVAITPDQGVEEIQFQYTPLLNYLSRILGIPFQLVVPANYSALQELWANGQLDLAYMGGVTFLQAYRQHGAVPLVMRDEGVRISSLFLARADSPYHQLSDFKGAKMAFGAQLSTSGYFMPRYFFAYGLGSATEVAPEAFFSQVQHASRHDLAAYWVRDGLVDLGAASAPIVRRMFRDGRLSPKEVRVVWETPFFADQVWAVARQVGEVDRSRLLKAFLTLSQEQPDQAEVLHRLDTVGFIPASVDDFAILERMVNKTGVLP